MSLRAAAQVVLDDLEDIKAKGMLGGDDEVSNAIDTLKDGLLEHRAEENAVDLYRKAKRLVEAMMAAPHDSPAVQRDLASLAAVVSRVTHGEDA